jgi:CheY-like chemotaxis protein
MVKETLKLLRASLPSTIEIRQDVSEEAGMVLADPTQMQQVLMNLGTNAAYAMRATGGVLEVSLDPVAVDAILAAGHPQLRPGPYVRLTVCDTGHGMPPGVLERIWEPFFTTKGVGEGTGMGLAVVHGIVTSHEGAITATSVPGQGTTFAVYLPRIKGAAVARSHPEAPVPHGNEHILFVDDEAVLAHLGQEMLEHLGYTVTVRTSSLEALEVFRVTPQRFSLVITDQTMPNMTGETLCRELRRIRSDVPLILCTGFSHTMTEEQAKAAGIDAFLMKPFVVRDMGLVIRRVLEQHRTESGPTL